ncbi:RagB/SusD family nutrient uptake outer membrane protein [Pedobacter nyackensis]|uniref:Starch-binding associating with outer membrane n=1 Tax=Pedobacter nyackensis TaxID=475255 RepID=A0A1W2CQ02_9SPHI|nr:RagB/SusD family nutrient uptake outer membrane protein [Pedobacter nyackensis]SMC87337.1 Starch-binding associating with outer membrane [Pedobacter nyackensis]
MKTLKYIIVVLLLPALTNTSCKDYLNVKPKTEMTQEELFSTEGGFKDALNGVYIQMKGTNVYGRDMTMTTIEHLISSWDGDAIISTKVPYKLAHFNYTDVDAERSLSAIYGAEYKIIASINAILDHIDENRFVFRSPGVYETVKAECLAMRAYCHLDILRLFGPIPTDVNTGNKLAYVIHLSKTPNPLLSFAAFQEALLKDLDEAERLVKDIDPIVKNIAPTDAYFANRNLKMNYYAVKALQARAYLWFNNKGKAYECAKMVIDAKDSNGNPMFRLGKLADMSAKDYVLTCEHIFGLHDFALYTKYSSLYANGSLRKGSDNSIINSQLYGNTGTDIREANLWELITLPQSVLQGYVLKKYKVDESGTNFKQIPLLRISEMYMIAIETGQAADAQLLWTTFRSARGLQQNTLPADPVLIQNELLKEYRKEFYAEGQAFFAYKRLNAAQANVLFVPGEATLNYLIPMPKTEAN